MRDARRLRRRAGRIELASGSRDAALVREYAPNIVYEPGEKEIPIDYRQCRSTRCGNAPTDRSLDVSHTSAGVPATVFTHVVHQGGSTFVQYWFYYPDSNTTWAGSDKAYAVATAPLNLGHKLWGKVPKAPRYPGRHQDDWEGSLSTFHLPEALQSLNRTTLGGLKAVRQARQVSAPGFSALGAGGRRFESRRPDQFSPS